MRRLFLPLLMILFTFPAYNKSLVRTYSSLRKVVAVTPSHLARLPIFLASRPLYSTFKEELTPSGVVAVYRPKGWTSSDVVSKVKWIIINGEKNKLGIEKGKKYKTKTKIGHGGTLDPLAEGVLVLGVGSGTKLLSEYLSGEKGYRAVATLGCETDTQDCTGNVTEAMDCSSIAHEDIEKHVNTFKGQIAQIPPMFSALKKDGKRLYDLARKGIEVEREARQVMVYDLQYLRHELPEFGLDITCGGGLYVRTLIVDLARAAGGRANMKELLRTKQGMFTLTDCIHQDDWNYHQFCRSIRKCTEKKNSSQ